jgi:circadian clock protein KaiB
VKTKQVKSRTARLTGRPLKTKQDKWILQLYIAGRTSIAITALNNLKSICNEQLSERYRIEEIDLLKNPQRARTDQILAIPTLLRKLPLPRKLVIGDLSNKEQVIAGLDLK